MNSGRSMTSKGAQFTLIANVPYDTVRQDLVSEFRRFGRVELAMVVCDEASRHPHREWTSTAGYAFVRFNKRSEAAAAIQAAGLGLVTIKNVRVRADWARKDSYAKRGRVSAQQGAPLINNNGIPDGIQALRTSLLSRGLTQESSPIWVASQLPKAAAAMYHSFQGIQFSPNSPSGLFSSATVASHTSPNDSQVDNCEATPIFSTDTAFAHRHFPTTVTPLNMSGSGTTEVKTPRGNKTLDTLDLYPDTSFVDFHHQAHQHHSQSSGSPLWHVSNTSASITSDAAMLSPLQLPQPFCSIHQYQTQGQNDIHFARRRYQKREATPTNTKIDVQDANPVVIPQAAPSPSTDCTPSFESNVDSSRDDALDLIAPLTTFTHAYPSNLSPERHTEVLNSEEPLYSWTDSKPEEVGAKSTPHVKEKQSANSSEPDGRDRTDAVGSVCCSSESVVGVISTGQEKHDSSQFPHPPLYSVTQSKLDATSIPHSTSPSTSHSTAAEASGKGREDHPPALWCAMQNQENGESLTLASSLNSNQRSIDDDRNAGPSEPTSSAGTEPLGSPLSIKSAFVKLPSLDSQKHYLTNDECTPITKTPPFDALCAQFADLITVSSSDGNASSSTNESLTPNTPRPMLEPGATCVSSGSKTANGHYVSPCLAGIDDKLSPCSRGLLAQALNDMAQNSLHDQSPAADLTNLSTFSITASRPEDLLRAAVKCCDLAGIHL